MYDCHVAKLQDNNETSPIDLLPLPFPKARYRVHGNHQLMALIQVSAWSRGTCAHCQLAVCDDSSHQRAAVLRSCFTAYYTLGASQCQLLTMLAATLPTFPFYFQIMQHTRMNASLANTPCSQPYPRPIDCEPPTSFILCSRSPTVTISFAGCVGEADVPPKQACDMHGYHTLLHLRPTRV